jgi:hypothetical protein
MHHPNNTNTNTTHKYTQTGRSDSYRVATVPSVEDDNLTADGQYRVSYMT